MRAEKSNFPDECVFAAVVLKEHARRTMQLRHDHPLSTVYDERTCVSHEWNLTHVHFLFLDFLYRWLGRFLVHYRQPDFCPKRGCIGKAALLAFFYIERRSAQYIIYEIETCIPGMTFDRKNRRKRSLQPLIGTTIGRQPEPAGKLRKSRFA